jgi:2-succinyl-5-enolpyruvyl-6-hydroxy-3-cyclohexene-1-carboxylate synthase
MPSAAPFTSSVAGRRVLSDQAISDLAGRFRSNERGLIVAGPQDAPALPATLSRLAAATGYPILADPLSQVRLGRHDLRYVIAHGDLLVRPGAWIAANSPQLVLRFGAMPTSKPILQLLQAARPEQIVVDGDGGWREAALLPSLFLHADGPLFAESMADALSADAPGAEWVDSWRAADAVAAAEIGDWLRTHAGTEPVEALPFAILPDLMPNGGIVFAGNSMPVRDMDTYMPGGAAPIRCLANRGANGIDGVISTALGVAASGPGSVVLVVGDLSFLHDLNALAIAKLQSLSATIVLTNNDGGGIFSFLPQASADVPAVGLPDAFEELFGTPHGVDFGPIVRALGGEHELVGVGQLRQALAGAIGAAGVHVLEVRTDRSRNVAQHREVAARVAAALDILTAGTGRR